MTDQQFKKEYGSAIVAMVSNWRDRWRRHNWTLHECMERMEDWRHDP